MRSGPEAPRNTGRFAPSPTGDLHFGSLLAAVASYLQARRSGGRWLLRIDDIDPPRELPGSAERIIRDLSRFGMIPDGPILYQSSRTDAYLRARDRLLEAGAAYWCGCSRSDLPDSGVYPGTCSAGLPPGRKPRAVRLRVPADPVVFTDRIQGRIVDDLAESIGDFVIWRADELPAYQLAVVVDDAYQGVTEIVRGADLLHCTARQIHLQHCLSLPSPSYAHHPVALGPDGKKLSKRDGADPVAASTRERVLRLALNFLGQRCPGGLGLAETWEWAQDHWRLEAVPRQLALRLPQ